MQDLRLGEMRTLVERRLENHRPASDEWIEALRAERPRPGVHKTSPSWYALAAKRRVEAEEARPGAAIQYMVERWPKKFPSESAAHSVIHKARVKGLYEKNPPRLTDQAKEWLSGVD
jgi:hypothetical protein